MVDLDKLVAAWWLGDDGNVDPATIAAAGVQRDGAGIAERLVNVYGDVPIGPAQQLAVGGATLGLVVPGLAQSATFSIEATSVRLAVDGTAATAAVGLLLPVGTIGKITGRASLVAASFRGTAAGAIVNVTYWT